MNRRIDDSIVYAGGIALFALKTAVAASVGIWSFSTDHIGLGVLCSVLLVTGTLATRGMYRRFRVAKEEEQALAGIPTVRPSLKK